MIRLLQGVVFALGLAGVPLAEAATHVKTLTAENFQKSVLESTDLWLIEFASPSQFILEENMDGLPRKVSKSGVRVGSMDCDDPANLKICRLYGFRGSYALSGFFEKPEPNPYTKKNIRKYQPFAGSTTPKAIEKFLSKNCPDLIRRVTTAEELKEAVFVAPVNAVVIFGEKENPTMYYKTLAVRFSKHALQFVYVQSSKSELMEAFPDVTESPAVVVYADGEAVRYEEDLTERQELIQWLKEYAGEEVESPRQQSHDSDELMIKLKDLVGTEEFPMSQVIVVVNENADKEVSEWSKAVEETDSAVEFRELRCGSEDDSHGMYSALCGAGEATVPYLLVLPYGSEQKEKALKSPAKHIHPVSSIDAAHKKAMDSLPNLVTVINSYDPPEKMNQFLVEGVKSNRITILVFSDKTTPPASLKGLAAAEAKHLQVGFVAEPTDQILGNFGWSRARGIPLALGTYYSDGVREKQQHDTNWEKGPDAQEGEDVGFRVLYYEPDMLGPMRFTSLRVFAGSVFQKSGLSSIGSGGNSGSTAAAKRQEAVDIINSEADWNTACPDSMMGICVIGFLSAPSDAAAADAYSMDPNALSTLTDVMVATQKESPAFHFVAGNIGCLSDFGSQFGVDPFNTPVIAIYSPGKGRYALYRGSFVEAELRYFLGQVLRGGETTHALSRPVIVDGIDCSVPPTDTLVESDALGDEDAEDFLAEIRREEQERAAQLEKELAEEKARLEQEAKKGTSKKKKSKKKKKATKKSEL